MKNEKQPGGDPYKADQTPTPPQQMKPGEESPRAEQKASNEKQSRKREKPSDQEGKNENAEKLLGESDTEITDETTI